MPRSTHPRASARSRNAATLGRPPARRLRYARMLAMGLVLAITGIAHTTNPPETSAQVTSAQAASARIAFAHEIPTQADADATVTVVSRNIYLGADVGSALELLPDMPAAAQLMWSRWQPPTSHGERRCWQRSWRRMLPMWSQFRKQRPGSADRHCSDRPRLFSIFSPNCSKRLRTREWSSTSSHPPVTGQR